MFNAYTLDKVNTFNVPSREGHDNIMTKLLEENHIALPEFAKRWELKQGNGKTEHALGSWVKPNYVFSISDSSFFYSHSDIS